MTEHIVASMADGILTLLMDRAAKKNALTDAMYGALADAIAGADGDDAVRVIVILGAGDTFTAGNDLADFAAAKPGAPAGNVHRFLHAIAGMAKPLVAGVQGGAIGIGTTMLLHCDHVVLADDARLATPFAALGLVPEAASSLLLPARIGHGRAFAMLALGEVVEARDALAWGLAAAVVPVAELAAATQAAAARIAARPPGAVQATKRLMRDPPALIVRMDAESAEFARRLQGPEARQALAAFAARRAPGSTQGN